MATLAIALAAAAAAWLGGRRWPAAAAPTAVLGSALALVAALYGLAGPRADVVVSWAPSLGITTKLTDDALARLYVVLATGIGLFVSIYAAGYLPHHLQHRGRQQRDAASFFGLLLLFEAAMVGLARAGDLVLLFFFFDLTAICSYLLIGYDRGQQRARAAALLSLLVTVSAAVLLLVAAALALVATGTTDIGELAADPPTGATGVAIAALIAIAAIAKSAQVPLHFWLPRAMAAPTPVSAYLHSAAMVAAGVFVLQRTHALVVGSQVVEDLLVVIGGASLLVGGVMALAREEMKQVLAYSTIAQYGYVVVMLGVGTGHALAAAVFHVPAHGLAKSAWFMVAGSVTEATGEKKLARLGGLWRRMPGTAFAAAAASATLAGVPLTIGFFKDELVFGAADGAAAWFVVAGAGLATAYAFRLWGGVFLGRERRADRTDGALRRVPRTMLAPAIALATAAIAFASGATVAPVTTAAAEAAAVEGSVEVGYHFDLRRTNVMALVAWSLGIALLATRTRWHPALQRSVRKLRTWSPTHGYRTGLEGLNRLSDRLHDLEVRDLRDRVAAVLVPTGVLIVLGLWASGAESGYRLEDLDAIEAPLAALLAAAGASAIAAALTRSHLAVVLLVSLTGFLLAVAFVALGAPDVALVAVLVGTVTTLIVLAILRVFPLATLRELEAASPRFRDHVVGGLATTAAALLTWRVLSETEGTSVADRQIALAPDAHAKDVVTAILADFRGLDTLGEASVLLVATLGVVMLLATTRRARSGRSLAPDEATRPDR